MGDEDEDGLIRAVESDVSRAAAKRRLEIASSLWIAARNYSRHVGIRELPADEKRTVLDGICNVALDIAEGPSVGGNDFTRALIRLGCNEAMGDCYRAAERILGHPIEIDLKLPPDLSGRGDAEGG